MTAWILSLMVILQPTAPWRNSYERTAQTIADVVNEETPLFAGTQGRERTAALLVSTAWFESTFKPSAIGDHGTSLGLFQISQSNFLALGVTRVEFLEDASVEARSAVAMMRESFKVCASHPREEWLAQYASGGGTCTNKGGLEKSRHRVGLAMRLFSKHPPDVPTT